MLKAGNFSFQHEIGVSIRRDTDSFGVTHISGFHAANWPARNGVWSSRKPAKDSEIA